VACIIWVHVTLGDVSMPRHSGLTVSGNILLLLPAEFPGAPKSRTPSNRPSNILYPMVEIGPRGSLDLRPSSLCDFGVQGFCYLVSFLLRSGQRRTDHGLDPTVKREVPKYPRIDGPRRFVTSTFGGFLFSFLFTPEVVSVGLTTV
jgi:hypothetical protein